MCKYKSISGGARLKNFREKFKLNFAALRQARRACLRSCGRLQQSRRAALIEKFSLRRGHFEGGFHVRDGFPVRGLNNQIRANIHHLIFQQVEPLFGEHV